MGTPSRWAEKSVPWSRLNPRRKYWFAFPGTGVLRGDHAGHRFDEFADAQQRRQVVVGVADHPFGGRRRGADVVLGATVDDDLFVDVGFGVVVVVVVARRGERGCRDQAEAAWHQPRAHAASATVDSGRHPVRVPKARHISSATRGHQCPLARAARATKLSRELGRLGSLDANREDVALGAVQHAVGRGPEEQPESVTTVAADDDQIHAFRLGRTMDLACRTPSDDVLALRRYLEPAGKLGDKRRRLLAHLEHFAGMQFREYDSAVGQVGGLDHMHDVQVGIG